MDNLVLLTFEEAEAHEGTDLHTLQESEPAFYSRVQSALAQIRQELAA